jgi:aspartate/methionine/tyrosine aminotransferase
MTGWRVGWMILPEDMVRTTERLAQNFFVSPSYISQVAAEAAFDCHDELQSNRAGYARARELLLAGLPAAGFADFAPPDGAFYVYLSSAGHAPDSTTFCHILLDQAGIAATPGHDFDQAGGNHYFRFSYCAALPDIEDAIARLQRLQVKTSL